MKFYFIKNLKGEKLVKEKIRDFKMVVIIQVYLLMTALLGAEVFDLIGIPYGRKVAETLFFIGVGLYVLSLWDMLRIYSKSKELIIFLFLFVMGNFLIAFVTVNPFYRPFNYETTRILSFIVMFSLFSIEWITVYFSTIEIFKRDLPIEERLWGAACIYLIVGIAFGGLYEMTAILDYEKLNLGHELGASHFMSSIFYSFLILAGLDNPYFDTANIVVRINTIEAVWGNLFIVFVVGRILYK